MECRKNRIPKLMSHSQSGPDLFINMDDEMISLGTFHRLVNEAIDAVNAAHDAMTQLDHGCADDSAPRLMGDLALNYAYDCLVAISPDKDVKGRDLRVDDNGKITLAELQAKQPNATKGGAA